MTIRSTINRFAGALLICFVCVGASVGQQTPIGVPDSNSAKSTQGHVPNQILVKFQDEFRGQRASGLAQSIGASDIRPLFPPGQSRAGQWHLLTLPSGKNPKALMAQIYNRPDVVAVSLNHYLYGDAVPTDPQFENQWNLLNTGIAGGVPDADIDADEAWDVQTGSVSVIIAVIDSGIDLAHSDLSANLWVNGGEIAGNSVDDDGNGYIDDVNGYDFFNVDSIPDDVHGHGTQVAGIAAAVGNNGIGIAGVSWSSKIMALRFMDDQAVGTEAAAVEAINYAVANGADIINASFGNNIFSTPIYDAIAAANTAGIPFVASAGNDNSDNDLIPHYPSSYDLANIIAVASTDDFDTIFTGGAGSNTGLTSVDLGAPGVFVITTNTGGSYTSAIGTSMAAPHVSGALALVLSDQPGLSVAGAKSLVMDYGDPKVALSNTTASGRRLNVNNAINCNSSVMQIHTDSLTDGFSVKFGEPIALRATISSCGQPVTGASVSVSFDNGEPTSTLFDDGVSSDTAANDGTYGTLWTPSVVSAATATISASHSSFPTVNKVVSGNIADRIRYQHETAVFGMIDTSAGTSHTIAPDSNVNVAIGFPFEFYGQPQTNVTISENGYLTFGADAPIFLNPLMPDPALPNSVIAPYWDDLGIATGAVRSLVDGIAPNRRLTVDWSNVLIAGSIDPITFQVTLYEGSNDVVFQYQDVSAGNPLYDKGVGASVGLEDVDGLDATPLGINQARLADGTAHRFYVTATTPETHYQVAIDTSTVRGVAGTLVMSVVDGDGINNNHISILEFATDGSIAFNPALLGDASGTFLPGPAHLGDSQFWNQIDQLMVKGDVISFRLAVSTNGTYTPFPDSYAFYIIDDVGVLYPTDDPFGTNALFAIEIDEVQPGPDVYNSSQIGVTIDTIGAPTAVIVAASVADVDQVVSFDGTGSFDPDATGIVSYDWDFGDGGVGTGATINHSYSSAGTYTIGLQVSDGILYSPITTHQITVAAGQPPTADAGADQTILEKRLITLDGTLSTDDGVISSYLWEQIAGPVPAVSEPFDTAITFIIAPEVTQLEVMTFKLTVTDNADLTDTDIVNIVVNNVLAAPNVYAGGDFTVDEGANVVLRGVASDDGTIISYLWTQITGPAVTLTTPDQRDSGFTAPNVPEDTVLSFLLTVTDQDGLVGTDTANITVLAANVLPIADAGLDLSVNEGDDFQLDGTASSDPNGTIVVYEWTQVAGPPLLNTGGGERSFPIFSSAPFLQAPLVENADSATLLLTITDDRGGQSSDNVVVNISNIFSTPVAVAGPDQIVFEGDSVYLDGSASTDELGTIVSYEWIDENFFDMVPFSDRLTSMASFVAPDVSVTTDVTIFLVVRNDSDQSHFDQVVVTVLDTDVDVDADGLPDSWETFHFGDIASQDGFGDPDSDGLSNLQEFEQGTDPNIAEPIPELVSVIAAIPGDGQNHITWQSVPGTVSNNIYFSTSSGVTQGSGTKLSNVTSPFTHTNLTNGVTYYYVVTSANLAGESPDSPQVNATPNIKQWGIASGHAVIDTEFSFTKDGFDIATSDNGDAILVWSESDGTRKNMWAKRYTLAQGWSASTLLEAMDIGSAQFPAVAINATGDGVAVWTQWDGTRANLWSSFLSASTNAWSSPTLVETYDGSLYEDGDVTHSSADVAIWDDGRALAIWTQDEARFFSGGTGRIEETAYVSEYAPSAGTWQGRKLMDAKNTVGFSDGLVVDSGANGKALIAWNRTDDVDGPNVFGPQAESVWARRYEVGIGLSLSTRLDTSADDEGADSVNVSLNGNGDGIATWLQQNGNPIDLVSRAFSIASDWSGQTETVDSRASTVFSPVLDMNDAGSAVSLWSQSGNIWTSTYAVGTGWGSANNTDRDGGSPTGVGVSIVGSAIGAWEYAADMYAAHYDPSSGWANKVDIDGGFGVAIDSAFASTESGTTFVAWAVNSQLIVNRFGVIPPTPNVPPTANAGVDQTVFEGSLITLDGSASSDTDGSISTYAWSQTTGPAVVLSDAAAVSPTFTAPAVTGDTTLTFELMVTDDDSESSLDTVDIVVQIAPPNVPPTANAGVDQTAIEGTLVTLDGTASSDSDGTITGYAWAQTAGPAVVLSDASAISPTFTAPSVAGDTTLTFQLTVTDDDLATGQDFVNIVVQVTPPNSPPTANAGPDQTVGEGTIVTLDGTGSSDVEGPIASFSWVQTAGPTVTLSDSAAPSPTFTAPAVSVDTVLTFELTVTDSDLANATDSVNITVQDAVDVTPPVTTVSTVKGKSQGITYYDITLTADEPATTTFRITGDGVIVSGANPTTAFQTYTGTFRIEIPVRNGVAVLDFFSVDTVGNIETTQIINLNQ